MSPRPVSPAPVSPRQAISPQSTRGNSSEQSWRALEDDSPASSQVRIPRPHSQDLQACLWEWRQAAAMLDTSDVQPKAAAGKRGEPLKAAKAGEAKQPLLKNGKSGFGKFFSFSGKRSAAAAAAAAAASPLAGEEPLGFVVTVYVRLERAPLCAPALSESQLLQLAYHQSGHNCSTFLNVPQPSNAVTCTALC